MGKYLRSLGGGKRNQPRRSGKKKKREQRCASRHLPRSPKPADMPPRTLRTIHSRSSLSSSSISKAIVRKWDWLLEISFVHSGRGVPPPTGGVVEVEFDVGSQIVSRKRRNSLVMDE